MGATAARADPAAPKWEFDGFAGGHYFSPNNELGARDEVGAASPGDAVAFGLRLGYWITPTFAVEVEGIGMPTEAVLGTAVSEQFIAGYRLSGRVQFGSGRLRPFVLAGLGGASNSSERDEILLDDTDFALHAGGGVSYLVGRDWGVRADVRALLPPSSDPDKAMALDAEALIGIYKRFGARDVARPPPPDIADRDRDGVGDAEDRCPADPEDADGFEDRNGCPDPDNDGDGLADASDRCPVQPETMNQIDDGDGCPDEVPAAVRRFTGAIVGIRFERGSAVLTATSSSTLDAAARILAEYPDLRIEVGGHTDDRGAAETNRALSRRRADAVVAYLVSKGIAADRLVAVGYGPDRPIADNTTAAGQADNRRVEFTLLTEPASRP